MRGVAGSGEIALFIDIHKQPATHCKQNTHTHKHTSRRFGSGAALCLYLLRLILASFPSRVDFIHAARERKDSDNSKENTEFLQSEGSGGGGTDLHMQVILFMCIISEGLIVVLCGKEKEEERRVVCVRWHASAQAQRGRDLREKCLGWRLRLRPRARLHAKKRTRAAGFHSNPGLTYTWKRRLGEIIGHTTSALKNWTFVLPSQCVKIRPGEPSLKHSHDFFFWKCSINISDFASLLSARCASFKQANRVD